MLLLLSHPVTSNSLWPHGLQHARLPRPSPSPEVCPSSSPLHRWCRQVISSSDAFVSFCPQSFPSIGDFSNQSAVCIRWQNTGVSASASVLPRSIQGWFPWRLTGLILLSKGPSGVFSSITVWRQQFFGAPPTLCLWFSQPYLATGKTIALTIWTFVSRVMSLLFSMLSRFVIAFLPRSKCLLISRLQSPSMVISDLKKRKSITTTFSPSVCHKVKVPNAMISGFFFFNI